MLTGTAASVGRAGGQPELAAFLLGESELTHMPSRPRLNVMQIATATVPEPWMLPVGAVASAMSRGHGELLAALKQQLQSSSFLLLQSRLPVCTAGCMKMAIKERVAYGCMPFCSMPRWPAFD